MVACEFFKYYLVTDYIGTTGQQQQFFGTAAILDLHGQPPQGDARLVSRCEHASPAPGNDETAILSHQGVIAGRHRLATGNRQGDPGNAWPQEFTVLDASSERNRAFDAVVQKSMNPVGGAVKDTIADRSRRAEQYGRLQLSSELAPLDFGVMHGTRESQRAGRQTGNLPVQRHSKLAVPDPPDILHHSVTQVPKPKQPRV